MCEGPGVQSGILGRQTEVRTVPGPDGVVTYHQPKLVDLPHPRSPPLHFYLVRSEKSHFYFIFTCTVYGAGTNQRL